MFQNRYAGLGVKGAHYLIAASIQSVEDLRDTHIPTVRALVGKHIPYSYGTRPTIPAAACLRSKMAG